MSRRRTLRTVAASALVAMVVAGCTDTDEAQAPSSPRAHYTALEVPADLGPVSPVVEQVGILGAADAAPWAVAAIRTMPGEVPRAVVWTADAGGALPADPVELPVQGEARSLVVAGSGKLTVAAVRHAVDGVAGTEILTSADRRTWSTIDVPGWSDVVVEAATVVGDDAIVVGSRVGSGQLVGVTVTAAGEFEPLGMPTTPDADRRLHLQAVAGHVGETAVVVSQDRGGRDEEVSVYRSVDFGATWVEDVIAGRAVRVAGFAATAHGYVLTVHVQSVRDPRVTRSAVWTARTGAEGFERDLPAPTGGIKDDVWIGIPAAFDDGYRVQIGGPYTTNVGLADDDGAIIAVSGKLGERGMLGQTAVAADGTVRTIATAHGGALVLEARGDALEPVATLAEPQRWFALGADDGADVISARSSAIVDWEEGWRRVRSQRRLVLEPDRDRLVAAPQDDVVQGAESVRLDASGPESDLAVVFGPAPGEPGSFQGVPWARGPDGVWREGSMPGLTGGGMPVWVGNRWLLPLETGEGLGPDDARAAALWMSQDGLTWAEVPGFDGRRGESADTVCGLGESDALVLGSFKTTPTVRAWVGGTWVATDLTLDGRRDPHDCYVAADGRTVVRMSDGDGILLLATDERLGTQEVLSTGPDRSIGQVRAVPGGFAAVGRAHVGDEYRAVIWLSHDGVDWRTVDGPPGEDSLTRLAVLDGTIVVMTDDNRGSRAWRVDIGDVMSAASVTKDQ